MAEPPGTLLTDLPGDLLARIYSLLGDGESAAASRKAFFSTCKALRADQVIAHISSLTLDVSKGDSFERLSTFPRGATLRHVCLRGTATSCPDPNQEDLLLLILLRGPLSRFQNVTAVTLQDCYLAPQNVQTLVHALQTRFPLLISLTLQHCQGSIDLMLQHMGSPPELHHFQQQLQSLHIHGLVATSNRALSISTVSCTQPARLLPFKHLRHVSLSMPRPLFYSFERGELACLSELPLLESLELGSEASEEHSGLEELLQRSSSLKKLQVYKLPTSIPSLRSSTLQHLVLEHLPLHRHVDLALLSQNGLLPWSKLVKLSVLNLSVGGPRDQLVYQAERAAKYQADETGLASLTDWSSCCMSVQDMVPASAATSWCSSREDVRTGVWTSGTSVSNSISISFGSEEDDEDEGAISPSEDDGSPSIPLAHLFNSLHSHGSGSEIEASPHNHQGHNTGGLSGTTSGQQGTTESQQHGTSTARGVGAAVGQQHGISTTSRQQGTTESQQHGTSTAQGVGAAVGEQNGHTTDGQQGTVDSQQHGTSTAQGVGAAVGQQNKHARTGTPQGAQQSLQGSGECHEIGVNNGGTGSHDSERSCGKETKERGSALSSIFSAACDCTKECPEGLPLLWRLLDHFVPLGHMREWQLHRCDLSPGSLAAGLKVCKARTLVLINCNLATTSLAEAEKAMPHLETIHIRRCQGLLTASLTLLAAHAQHRCEPLTIHLQNVISAPRQGAKVEPHPLIESFVREFGAVVSSLNGVNGPHAESKLRLVFNK